MPFTAALERGVFHRSSQTSVPGARIVLYSFVFMVIPKIVLFLLESVRFRFDIFLYFIIIII